MYTLTYVDFSHFLAEPRQNNRKKDRHFNNFVSEIIIDVFQKETINKMFMVILYHVYYLFKGLCCHMCMYRHIFLMQINFNIV